MRAPVNLIAQVESPDGRIDTYSPASRDPRRVPTEMEFSTKTQVGDEALNFVLPRGNRRRGEIESGKQMRFVGAGGYVAASGRVSGNPVNSAKGVTYRGIGNWQSLKDSVFPFLGIDQDWGHWGEMSLAEKIRLTAAGVDIASVPVQGDGDGVVFALPNQALGANVQTQHWYAAPPGTIVGSLDYNGTDVGMPAGWQAGYVYFVDDNTISGPNFSSALLTLDGVDRSSDSPRSTARFVMLRVSSDGAVATPAAGANRRYTKLAVRGLNPGLTSLTASEVIKYALQRAAPDLTFDADSIDDTSFEFAQLIQDGNLRAEDLILKLNACHLFDVGVYGQRFFFKSQRPLGNPDDYEWELSPYRGDQREFDDDAWDEKGPFNGVWVIYTDVATGREEMVGPYGSGPYDDPLGSDLLRDDSPDNPINVNMPGRPRHAVLKISEKTTYDIAVTSGAVFLREHATSPTSGEFETGGPWIKNRAGAWEPAYKMKEGDRVKYADEHRVHKVVSTSYSTTSKKCKGATGDLPYTLDAILERMGIAMVEVRG